jgi:gliding motility-associated-like protein
VNKAWLPYRRMKEKSIVCWLFFLYPFLLHAEGLDTFGVYVSPNATLYVQGTNIQMSIMSRVINSGAFGTMQGAMVNMMGNAWRNTAGASFPDESGINSFTGTGGIFRFNSLVSQQHVTSSYSVAGKTGTSFPNITVDNPFGLQLFGSDAHIRSVLHFSNGMLSLNGYNLLVGVNDPGTISGYTENKFVLTGNTVAGGYLYRAKVTGSSGSVMFPVGAQAETYAPMAVMFNSPVPQDVRARVFDNIYRNAFAGTTGSPASVQQTWNIGHEISGKVPAIVALQHMTRNEGALFTVHRGSSFVSRYDFGIKTWDTLEPADIITPGTHTTGVPFAQSHIHARSFDSLGANTYLTKTADTRGDSITLAKAALTPILQPDGSFMVTYVFLVHNGGRIPAHSLQVFDTLSKVFTSPATYSVSSVKASGSLVANTAFDGEGATNLLLSTSTLATKKTDTITLVLNVVTNSREGYFYNNAFVRGTLNGSNNRQYVINNQSVDGITPPDPAAPPVPTPVALTASKYQMPQGFSPNGDGVNDRLIIGNVGATDNAALWIFNKQGVLVYRNANYKNDWDGISNQGGPGQNQRVEDGTYFYKVIITETTGKQQTFYGYLSIWKQ